MDIFFQDPTEIPLPPDEVKIRALKAEPWPDARRVRVYLEFDPFLKRPSADVFLTEDSGSQVASISIVESLSRRVELTMHLRSPLPGSRLTLTAQLYYLAPPPEAGDDIELSPPQVIDQQQVTFYLPILGE